MAGWTRREFLSAGARAGLGAAFLPAACRRAAPVPEGVWLDDVHSKLNRTYVYRVVRPRQVDDVRRALEAARNEGRTVSIAGGRHAMGGQQFGTGAVHLDMTAMNGVLEFDAAAGEVEVAAGAIWPDLLDDLRRLQGGGERRWGIVQKQTGADRLTVGGALAANAHGRSLALPPFVVSVEAFTLLDAEGQPRRCSRRENVDLFRLAVGGYGLFGVVTSVRLRLGPRVKVERSVEVRDADEAVEVLEDRATRGHLYGDFQFSTDADSDGFLRRGLLTTYRPVSPTTPVPARQRELSTDDWKRLILLGHVDRARAFEAYTAHYLATNGQVYWSDEQELAHYVDDYHAWLDREVGAPVPGSEMITEVYVPRPMLPRFLAETAEECRADRTPVVYGVVRLIERDDETFLAWARERWACVVLNLHVDRDEAGIERSAERLRRLIDRALAYGGTYYLTYHRWATREQVLAGHPRFPIFLAAKRRFDPDERFQSDWYRHHVRLLGGAT